MDTDIRILEVEPLFGEEKFRTPLKFGAGEIHSITSFTVKVKVENRKGRTADGWGNILLSDLWAFPCAAVTHEKKDELMRALCLEYCKIYQNYNEFGHPVEIYYNLKEELGLKAKKLKESELISEDIPELVTLVCGSALDAAVHDAFGRVNKICAYMGYSAEFVSTDLSKYLGVEFKNRYISDYLKPVYKSELPVFHLVGGLDKLRACEIDGNDPEDGLPVSLDQWIEKDGVYCFKVKLKGTDIGWDVARTAEVYRVAAECLKKKGKGSVWLSTDSNEMNHGPEAVVEYLVKLKEKSSQAFKSLLYVEQPVERDLNIKRYDMRKVAALKPVLADEGITGIQEFILARELGWSGIALKTCKGHSSALMYIAMAEKYGLRYSVQDLTNPGISLIHSAGLAGRIDTIMGFEYNSRQYIPYAQPDTVSKYAKVFQVKDGCIKLDGLDKTGLGYAVNRAACKSDVS